ncbi:MAG: NAD-dependent epimerase/dehydratase family protein [Actinophytocola sp.]|nr:NAD-dependent epimerase/dehydratase family protein [Actinophytocola sp.]
MRVLVLGGTHHVGRALVETALARGDTVTMLRRGLSGVATAGVEARHADRRDEQALRAALGDDTYDAVVDTWSFEPSAVQRTARLLDGHAGHYAYVSSRSVYGWPLKCGSDESAPVVDGDPSSDDADGYAAAKRGAEIAVLEEFGGEVLLARAGLILGPYEDVGRLPWWLNRIARGGRVPAPGPQDRPLQYVDARDLSAWILHAAEQRRAGTFNAVSKSGHSTIGALLGACQAATGSRAELAWVTPEAVAACGVSGWTDLPIWAPPSGALSGLHDCDVSRAVAAGLRCRPVAETVADTWPWLRAEGASAPPTDRAGSIGLDEDQEACLLASA